MITYTIPDHNTLTNENPFFTLHSLLIHDKGDFDAEFDEDKQEEYLKSAHTLFMLKCQNIHNTDIQLSKTDEKELRFMLDAILSARHALYENKHGQ